MGDQQGAADVRAAQDLELIANGFAVSDRREPVEGGDADGGGWTGKVQSSTLFRAIGPALRSAPREAGWWSRGESNP